MAEIAKEVNGGDAKDLHSLLSSPTRDFLVRNDGEQVKIKSLKGKKIGLYFSAALCGPCQRFTPELVKVYKELSPKACFEIVFVSVDKDEESFRDYFSKMPWLAVPFTDSETRDRLDEVFEVSSIPTLVMVDDHGEAVNEYAALLIQLYGADAYPFTLERSEEIEEEEDRARREQTLKSVLVTPSRDFVISQDGSKVPVSELEGKTIGLFFWEAFHRPCMKFTRKLVDVYKKLKENGEDFEIVMISPPEDDEEFFKYDFKTKPWLTLPVNSKNMLKLFRHFMVSTLPVLVILGPDGKTRHPNAAEAIDEYGALAYPFTPEKFEELEQINKAKAEAQTLESLLVSGDLNYVLGKDREKVKLSIPFAPEKFKKLEKAKAEAQTLESLLVLGDLNYLLGKDGAKVLVSDLVGKNILLYFSAQSSSSCFAFIPYLAEVYKQAQEKDEAFELIFISSDRDQESFHEHYSEMPWLALPFNDPRKPSLENTFKVSGFPTLVVVGPTEKTVKEDATDLVGAHGTDAYPFTEERIKEIEAKYDEMAKDWPKKVKHDLHKAHELELTRVRVYMCDKCDDEGLVWSYHCDECDFDLHAKCALKEGTETKEVNSRDAKEVDGDDGKDLHSLLSSPTRDFLVRNDGEQVKIDSLKGKKIGLYFSAALRGPCQRFTPELVKVYKELSPKACFEIVFVSVDKDEESFRDYFSKMPWLAVPFTDSETRDRLEEVFKVSQIPTLVMVDDHGKVLSERGVDVIRDCGVDAYPFTPERMKEIKEEEDRARREQTLKSVLVTPSRDFVISQDGNKVPVSELQGKTIGLFFSGASDRPSMEFTPKLVDFYKKLKENGEDFEIVMISPKDGKESFKQYFETKPWLALPVNYRSAAKLAQHFMLSTLPALVILGPDGKTRHANAVEAINEYGVDAYPFTPEKLEELEKAKAKAQTLESLLVSGDLNYILGKDGAMAEAHCTKATDDEAVIL